MFKQIIFKSCTKMFLLMFGYADTTGSWRWMMKRVVVVHFSSSFSFEETTRKAEQSPLQFKAGDSPIKWDFIYKRSKLVLNCFMLNQFILELIYYMFQSKLRIPTVNEFYIAFVRQNYYYKIDSRPPDSSQNNVKEMFKIFLKDWILIFF